MYIVLLDHKYIIIMYDFIYCTKQALNIISWWNIIIRIVAAMRNMGLVLKLEPSLAHLEFGFQAAAEEDTSQYLLQVLHSYGNLELAQAYARSDL